jgi:hypothetical protein
LPVYATAANVTDGGDVGDAAGFYPPMLPSSNAPDGDDDGGATRPHWVL